MCKQFSSELYGFEIDAFTGIFFAEQKSIISFRPGNVSRYFLIRQGATTLIPGSNASAANWNRHWSFPLPVAPCANAFAPTSRATRKQAFAINGRAIDVPSR